MWRLWLWAAYAFFGLSLPFLAVAYLLICVADTLKTNAERRK